MINKIYALNSSEKDLMFEIITPHRGLRKYLLQHYTSHIPAKERKSKKCVGCHSWHYTLIGFSFSLLEYFLNTVTEEYELFMRDGDDRSFIHGQRGPMQWLSE